MYNACAQTRIPVRLAESPSGHWELRNAKLGTDRFGASRPAASGQTITNDRDRFKICPEIEMCSSPEGSPMFRGGSSG